MEEQLKMDLPGLRQEVKVICKKVRFSDLTHPNTRASKEAARKQLSTTT